MDIFCRNVPEQVGPNHLKKELTPVLARFNIIVFGCRRAGKKNAVLTILDSQKAQRLLDEYGQDEQRTRRPAKPLKIFAQPIYLSKSRTEPDEFALRHLRYEEEKHLAAQTATRTTNNVPRAPMSNAGSVAGGSVTHGHGHGQGHGPQIKSFNITTMSCGQWDYDGDRPVFIEFFRCPGFGKIVFGKSMLRIAMHNVAPSTEYYMEITYSNVDSIHVGTSQQATVTVTTQYAPRFFVSDLMEKLKAQTVKLLNKYAQAPSKRRVGHFAGNHGVTSGICFTYRFELQDSRDTFALSNLKGDGSVPPISRWVDKRFTYAQPFGFFKTRFEVSLEAQDIPFGLKFQLTKLVWNGDISVATMSELYPHILRLAELHGVENTINGLTMAALKLQYPSPDTHPRDVQVPALKILLEEMIERAKVQSSACFNLTHPNYVKVHRAQVTPSGIYLYGPNTETKNRVLRQHIDHINHFLRVEFVDETGDPLYFDPRSSQEEIYHGRFKGVLKQGIKIGERHFSFLGFSHSSLRNQTCWFVAPFTTKDGERFDAQSIIRGLGSFEHIRSPAKQAARIGQTFSETQSSIAVPEEAVFLNEPDIKRNGRVFSDGVGTLSLSLMYKIWSEYALREMVKPTVFQIRFAGMSSLYQTLYIAIADSKHFRRQGNGVIGHPTKRGPVGFTGVDGQIYGQQSLEHRDLRLWNQIATILSKLADYQNIGRPRCATRSFRESSS